MTAATSASNWPGVRDGKLAALIRIKSCVVPSASAARSLRPGTPMSLMAMPRMSPLLSGLTTLAELEKRTHAL